MVDRQYRDELLDASYEAVKLELENTEKDLARLKDRTEKLRSAVAALAELLPGTGKVDEDLVPPFLRKAQRDNGLHETRSGGGDPVSEVARASA
jgi:hypothetical protein